MEPTVPPGFVAIPLKGAVLVIPERVYVAGLRLGKTLRRRQAEHDRAAEARNGRSAVVLDDT